MKFFESISFWTIFNVVIALVCFGGAVQAYTEGRIWLTVLNLALGGLNAFIAYANIKSQRAQ